LGRLEKGELVVGAVGREGRRSGLAEELAEGEGGFGGEVAVVIVEADVDVGGFCREKTDTGGYFPKLGDGVVVVVAGLGVVGFFQVVGIAAVAAQVGERGVGDFVDRRKEGRGVEAREIERDPGEFACAEIGEGGSEGVAFDPGAVAQLDGDGRERGKVFGDAVELVEAVALGAEARVEREEEGAEFAGVGDGTDRMEKAVGELGGGGLGIAGETLLEFHVEEEAGRGLVDPVGDAVARLERVVGGVEFDAVEELGVVAEALRFGDGFGEEQADVVFVPPTAATDVNGHGGECFQGKAGGKKRNRGVAAVLHEAAIGVDCADGVRLSRS